MRSQRRRAWELLGQTETPDGSDIRLTVRDDEYVILVNGDTLMSNRTHGLEEALATVACRRVQSAERPRVLVGGLGMGFTLRAALDLLPPDAIVTVPELVAAVVAWNRGPLGALAGHPLNDPRVRIKTREDVGDTLRMNLGRFDAILTGCRQRYSRIYRFCQSRALQQRGSRRRVRGAEGRGRSGRVVCLGRS